MKTAFLRLNTDDQEAQAVFDAFREAYGESEIPRNFGDPDHCPDCATANEKLKAIRWFMLTPEIVSQNNPDGWILAFCGPEGFEYFAPGFVRVLLEVPANNAWEVGNRISAEWVERLPEPRRQALKAVAQFAVSTGVSPHDLANLLQNKEEPNKAWVDNPLPAASRRLNPDENPLP
jgi:hypothetical protein